MKVVKQLDKKHILVVDDEENVLLGIQFILEVEGYQVTTAKNGNEALEKINKANNDGQLFQLLITDIQMPGLTGLELMDELKNMGIDIPTMVITGYGNCELKKELANKGCNGYIDKPIDEEELINRIGLLI